MTLRWWVLDRATGWGAILAILAGLVLFLAPPLWGATLILGAGAGLLMLVDPLIPLGLMLLAAPLGAFENRVLGSSLLDSGQLLLGATVVIWLAHGVLRREIRIPLGRLHVYLAPFLGVAALSLLGATSITAGWRELIKWLEIGLLMVLVVDLLERSPLLRRHLTGDTRWRGRLVLGLLLLAGLSQALGGIWQGMLRGSGPEHFLISGRFYRPYGTFDQPNPYGGFVGMNALLAWGAVLGAVRARAWRDGPERLWLIFLIFVAVAATVAVLLSWSRGAWLGLAAGGVALALFLPRRRRVGAALLATGLILGAVVYAGGLVPGAIADRLGSITSDFRLGDVRGVDINDQNYAVLERLAHWQSAIDMAEDRPWLGVGFGNYEAAYPAYALLNWPFPLGHAHNYYLNLMAETGLVGIIAYLVFWGGVIRFTVRLLRRLDDPARGVALGALGVWAALAVHHLVDNLYVNNIYLILGVLLGLLIWLERTEAS